MTDTIFALSSGQPPAGIGVIRISGPRAGDALRIMGGSTDRQRTARLFTICDPLDGTALDQALQLWFPGPGSATGEDLAEFHCHGGRAVVAAILAALGRIEGLRGAEPGEFTRRAFENGRIDLNEAEGLADLLSAETEMQRRSAMALADGHFTRKVKMWEAAIVELAALAEAELDFGDEDDVASSGTLALREQKLDALISQLADELERPSAERLRDGVRVVIAGPPNAGKSTLLNRLAGEDAAIVSDIAGTTRDRIDVPVQMGGVPYVLTDTAGLRDESSDAIEVIGMGRAQQAVAAADILLWLGDPAEAPRSDAVIVAAQCDRAGWAMPQGADIAISVTEEKGIVELQALLAERASALLPRLGGYALHERQREALSELHSELQDCGQVADDLLLFAEHLRRGRQAIDRLTGRAGTEDMLNRLFSGFCIGK